MCLYNCSEAPKIQYLKRSAQRGTSPSFHTCVIKCVVVSKFEFTVNEATTSSYVLRCMEGETKQRLVIATILMLAITESIAGKWL